MLLKIYTDGGARGNPGPAAIGVVIYNEDKKLINKFGKKIGSTTNNVAEYTAVVEALNWTRNQGSGIRNGEFGIHFFLDSTLVVNQLNGIFKIKSPDLRALLVKVRELEASLGGNILYSQIPREQNGEADSLVNQALDSF